MSTSTTMIVTVGTEAELEADLTNLLDQPGDASAVHWLVRDPAGVEHDKSQDVQHDGTGKYTLALLIDAPGHWYWRLVTEGLTVAAEGEVVGESMFDVIGDPTQPVDLRVLVPRVRRYCEGPYGPPRGRSPLGETQLYEMSADACADIILYTGSLFGHKLVVTQRDARAGFPVGWATERVLEEWEAALITTQAALNYWFFVFRDLRVSQAVRNEGTEVTYSLSVNIIRDYIATLRAARDAAITGLRAHHPVMDRFTSNIRVRDQATVAILEWWDHNSRGVVGSGLGGGQEASVVPWTPGWSGPGFSLGVSP